MALVCLAGGIDYFENSAAIQEAVGGLATSQGQGEVVETLDEVGGQVDTLKTDAMEAVPESVRDYLAPGTAVLGLAFLVWGVRVKTRVPGLERGRGLRDVGRVMLGPGALGVCLFLVITWQGAAGLRTATSSFVMRSSHR